jgi:hypothetical protein
MKDIPFFKAGGKDMTADEARIIGGRYRTDKLFKKHTPGLIYHYGVKVEGKNGDRTVLQHNKATGNSTGRGKEQSK